MENNTTILNQYLPNHAFETFGNAIFVPTNERMLEKTVGTLMRALPLVMLFATDETKKKSCFQIHYVFGVPGKSVFIVPKLTLHNTRRFPSLARKFPAFALYEREIITLFGLVAVGHPDPRSLVLHEENWQAGQYPMCKDFAWNTMLPHT